MRPFYARQSLKIKYSTQNSNVFSSLTFVAVDHDVKFICVITLRDLNLVTKVMMDPSANEIFGLVLYRALKIKH